MNKSFSKNKKRFWERISFKDLSWKTYLTVFLFLGFFVALVFANYYFKVKNIEVTFFDNNLENKEMQIKLAEIVQQENKSLLDFIFLNDYLISKFLKDEFPDVRDVKISKKIQVNQALLGNLGLQISVTKNKEFFYGCVPESSEFLITCMYGNEYGEFFKEYFEDMSTSKNLIKFEINPKILLAGEDVQNSEKKDLDSLSGTRVYKESDFLTLKEIYLWLQKNGFEVKKIVAKELKIVRFENNNYDVVVSLEKGYLNTLKDFELISKTGKLEKYINGDQEKIDYIDLSYKDKVFWKLKNGFEKDIENVIMSSTTATSSNR